jgi:DNA repair protein RadC
VTILLVDEPADRSIGWKDEERRLLKAVAGREIARRLGRTFKSSTQARQASRRELARVHGLGAELAGRLHAAFRLSAPPGQIDYRRRTYSFETPEDIREWFDHRYVDFSDERLDLVCFSADMHAWKHLAVESGDHRRVEVSPKEVLRQAVLNGASRVATIHTTFSRLERVHPSDSDFAWAMKKGGDALGIPYICHLIFRRPSVDTGAVVSHLNFDGWK